MIKSKTKNFKKTKFIEILRMAEYPQNNKILQKIFCQNDFLSKMTILNIFVSNTYKTRYPIIVLPFLPKMTRFSRPKKYARVPPYVLFCTCVLWSKLDILNMFVWISDHWWIKISILVVFEFCNLPIFQIFCGNLDSTLTNMSDVLFNFCKNRHFRKKTKKTSIKLVNV